MKQDQGRRWAGPLLPLLFLPSFFPYLFLSFPLFFCPSTPCLHWGPTVCEQRGSIPRRVILGLFTFLKKNVRFNKCLKSTAGDTGLWLSVFGVLTGTWAPLSAAHEGDSGWHVLRSLVIEAYWFLPSAVPPYGSAARTGWRSAMDPWHR